MTPLMVSDRPRSNRCVRGRSRALIASPYALAIDVNGLFGVKDDPVHDRHGKLFHAEIADRQGNETGFSVPPSARTALAVKLPSGEAT